MDVNKKSTALTWRQCNCPAGNAFEASNIYLSNNNTVMKDCNVVLPRLDTSGYNIADLLTITSKYSSELKVDNEEEKRLSGITEKGIKEKKCRMNEKVSNSKKLNEEDDEKKREIEVIALSSKRSAPCKKSSLKNNIQKKSMKKVSFKMPIAKYRIIKPVKRKITRKLLIMLTRCDNKDKRKLRSDI